ncbi:MAG TPA: SDR family oxidoreductase [Candidatus Limnocylindrales bacterium]|nr:SDR family oxidoreductase [Candidatus Limnocylindrales bacterium]
MTPSSDRVALVTGATGVLGGVVVRTFADDGWRLGLAGTDHARLEAVAAATALADDRWAPGVGDLSDRSAAEAAAADVVSRLGRIDALLHLVGGYAGGGPIVDFADDDLRRMLDQHLWSTLNIARAVVPGMVERGWGRVVAVTASTAVTTPPKLAAYSVAKGAEETLLRTLAREVAGHGVTVNIVAVRKIDTERVRETAPEPKNAGWTTPEEVAATMRHLCADDAAAITGQRIALDGRT